MVNAFIILTLDHKLILFMGFLSGNRGIINRDNMVIGDMEPGAKNILIYMRRCIKD
jgi:hypothetical protein